MEKKYQEGYEAFKAGKDSNSSPYEDGSDSDLLWQDGYLAASSEVDTN